MAIGEETALLEIEVDTSAFDKVEREHAQMQARIQRDIEKGAAAFERAKAREQAASDRASRQIAADIQRGVQAHEQQLKAIDKVQKKNAVAAAASIVAWREFFGFLNEGSGEAGEAFRQLMKEMEAAKASVAEATAASGPMQALHGLLSGIAMEANSGSVEVKILGEAVGSLAAPFLGAVAAMQTFSRQLSEITGIGQTTPRNVGSGAGGSVAARAEAARRAALGPLPPANLGEVRLEEVTIAAGGGRGGGGGGGDPMAATRAFLQAQREADEEVKRLRLQDLEDQRQVAREANEIAKQRANEDRAIRLAALQDTLRQEQEIRDAFQQTAIDQKRIETEDFEERERNKQAAIAATADALASYSAALMQGGKSAQAAGKAVMVVEAAIAGVRAAMEIGEALAAAARYDFGAAALHTLSAVQFGTVAAMKIGGATASAGGRGPGRRGEADRVRGGADFASPRGGTSAGGDTIVHNTFVVNAAGEVVDDGTLRRLSAAVNEGRRRGYQ